MTETLEATLGQGEALPETVAAPVEQAPTEAAQDNETLIERDSRVRDESGRFKKTSPEDAIKKAAESIKTISPENPEGQVISQPSVEELKAPDHWPVEFKDGFSKLPDAASKKLYIEAVKNVEAAHTKRSQELAPYKELDKVWEPYKDRGTPAQALQYYMGVERQFDTNPVEALKNLAKVYKVDLGQLTGQQQSDEIDHNEEFVDPKLQQLEQQFNGFQTFIQQQELAKAQAQINTHLAEKDEGGNPKYPHFEKLEPDMVFLTKSGKATSFQDAYEKALRLDPELSAQVETERFNRKMAEQEAARKADIEKAKKAATHLNGTAPAKVSTRARTPDEAIQMAARQQAIS